MWFWKRRKKPAVDIVAEEPANEDEDFIDADAVVELPIDGILDLHTFNPKEIKELVPEYIRECRLRGILHLRIIHGKGKGVLRKTVHAILNRSDEVADFRLAGPESGSWGATLVDLLPLDQRDGP